MRSLVVIGGLVVLVSTLGGVKFAEISKLMGMKKQADAAGPPPEAVASATSRTETWEGTLRAVGSVEGAKSVTLANDAAGAVKRIRFDSGDSVKQGQLLVELDADVERAQLAAAKSRRDLAELTVKRTRSLA